MKKTKNEYAGIASYSCLREAIAANRKARDRARGCMEKHSVALLRSLAPDALWSGFMQYISPLKALYEMFLREKR